MKRKKLTFGQRATCLSMLVVLPVILSKEVYADTNALDSPAASCGVHDNASSEPANDSNAIYSSTANYTVYSGGDSIGTLSRFKAYGKTNGSELIKNHLALDIKWLFLSYKLEVVESFCMLTGKIERYQGEFNEDGEVSQVQIYRHSDGHLVFTGTEGDKDEAFEKHVDGEVIGSLVEHAIASVIDKRETLVVKTVFDLEDFERKNITYRYGGRAEVTVAGQSFKTHVVEFDALNKKGTYWMLEKQGRYILVMERGEDSDGEYSVELQILKDDDSAQGN